MGLGSLSLKWAGFLLYTNAVSFLHIFCLFNSDPWFVSVMTQAFCMWGAFLLKHFNKAEYTMLI